MNKDTRMELFDIAKAIAIIFVVIGHLVFGKTRNFIYLFHMFFFFVLAGYFLKDKYYNSIENLVTYIKKKFSRLMLPYLLTSITTTLCHNIFVYLHFYKNEILYTSLKQYLVQYFVHIETVFAPIWFLFVLFFVLVIFSIISYVCKLLKENFEFNRFLVVLLFMQIGFFISTLHIKFLYIGTICSVLTCIYTGTLFAKYDITKLLNKYYGFLSIFILTFLTYALQKTIYISSNQYYNPALYLLLSIISFIFILIIAKSVQNKLMKTYFCYIGKNTMPILIFHTFFFKLVSYLYIKLHDLPLENMAYKTLGGPFWFIIYILAGIFIPLFCNYIYLEFKKIIQMQIEN